MGMQVLCTVIHRGLAVRAVRVPEDRPHLRLECAGVDVDLQGFAVCARDLD